MVIQIIPDIHLKQDIAEHYIQEAEADSVVFLGDYFDDWGDSPEDNRTTAKWLKDSFKDPKRIHLWGNHDFSYAYPHLGACSGFARDKHEAISSVLSVQDFLDNLKFFVYQDGWLMTHAGVNSKNFKSLEDFRLKCAASKADLMNNRSPELFQAGMARGGRAAWGGIIWQDWWGEFRPVPGLNQIVGHTVVSAPTQRVEDSSDNWNLDTNLQNYALLEDGKVMIL